MTVTIASFTSKNGQLKGSVMQDKFSACYRARVFFPDGTIFYKYDYYTSKKAARAAIMRQLRKPEGTMSK